MTSEDGDVGVFISAVVILTIGLVVLGWFTLRLSLLLRRPGALQCSLRRAGQGRWRTGVLVLEVTSLYWYSSRSPLCRPSVVLTRAGLAILGHHVRGGHEEMVIVDLDFHGRLVQLAMAPASFTGLVSWMDSAPPTEEPTYI